MPHPTLLKTPKRKPVHYELIAPESVIGAPMYALMAEIRSRDHLDLADAHILLAWCTSWKPDTDGRIILGKCKKASDLERELLGAEACDFVILLNKWWWRHREVNDFQRTAVLDHELCHAAPALDDAGAQKRDERGRLVWRVRKHDIEEFAAVVERHGCYRNEIEQFAQALVRAGIGEYQPCDVCKDTGSPGWQWIIDSAVPKLQRCACWTAYQQERKALAS